MKYDELEITLIGFCRTLNELLTDERNAENLFINQIMDDIQDAQNRLAKLQSRASHPDAAEVIPYGDDLR